MTDRESIQAAFAKAVAAMPSQDDGFPAPERVVFHLDPSTMGHQEQIDAITHWTRSPDRIGRARRTVITEEGKVIFEFESVVDAVECSLRFV